MLYYTPCIAQGKGIFLFSKLSEISEWKTDYKSLKQSNYMYNTTIASNNNNSSIGSGIGNDKKEIESYVVQRYLQYPYCIGRRMCWYSMYTL